MKLCVRCKKRPAVVFVTRMDGSNSVNEGYCLRCAKEMGLGPVNEIMEKMGITDEDLDRMENEMTSLIEASGDEDGESEDGTPDESGLGHTPPIDFRRLVEGLSSSGSGGSANNSSSGLPTPQKPQDDGKRRGERPPRGRGESASRKYLSSYCRDLTAMAAAGKLDRIVGRERELSRVQQILCRRQKNNPCLIGEPGVGKTAIAEALAMAIAEGKVPYKLRTKEVHLLDLTALVAGTQFRGQFESRMRGLIEEVKALGNIILVIDEVHSIVGAGDAEGSMSAANILKPALSRGEIQVIGATTLTEYRKYIEKDAALERRFQPIIVEEPSVEETVKILSGVKDYYESFHGVHIPDHTVYLAALLSERYITDRYLPDKAIDLLDEAASHLALATPTISERAEARENLRETTARREQIEQNPPEEGASEEQMSSHYKAIADLKTQEIGLHERIEQLDAECDKVVLTAKDLAEVIEIWTGIPAGNITEFEYEQVAGLGDRLKERIVGQDEAVDAVVRAIKRNRAGIAYKRKPVSFIFAGPTGVGKTELVKTLAADLFHSPESLIRLDMSEYMEKFAVSRIIGSPPGYVGYDDAGQLTEKVRRKPYSVVLFDEIEKAHPDVLNILLQILDDGRITDAGGRTVNFENTVIVMTTNAGSNLQSGAAGFAGSRAEVEAEKVQKALREFLRPEFLNRVDEVIVFRSLSREDFVSIADIMLRDLKTTLRDHGTAFTYTPAAARAIAEASFDERFGARNMRRYIERHVEDPIADKIIAGYERGITAVSLDADEGGELVITCV